MIPMKKSKKKKIKTTVMVLIIGAVLIAAVYAGSFAVDRLMHDPNFEMRYLSKSIKLDETKKVSYESSWLYPVNTVHIPCIVHIPRIVHIPYIVNTLYMGEHTSRKLWQKSE